MSARTFIFLTFFLVLYPLNSQAVYSCGGVNDTCPCGASNPYPCCDNGGNCTWYAWHSACCHWDMALPGWGNAQTWAQYANANPNYEVLSYPVVGAIACRTLGTYGHVAFVTAVSGNTITVEEENCCSTCAAGVRTWNYDASYFDGGYIIPLGGVIPPACSIEINGNPVVIDDASDCFEHHGTYWWDEAVGTDGHSYYTYATDDALADSWASWRLNVTVAGNYDISVMIPSSANDMTQQASYTVSHSAGETPVSVNQAANAGNWVFLGSFWLNEGTTQFVRLNDNTGENYDLRRVLLYDAISVEPTPQCQDECSEGERICEGSNGFKICGNFDGDSCLEWSSVEFCGLDEVCNGGTCEFNPAGCTDECTQTGYSCFSPTVLQYCGQFDEDSCLEYGNNEPCPDGTTCSNGQCISSSDGGTDSQTDAGDENNTASGCNCKTGTSKHSSLPFWLLLMAFTALSIRRKF